jgi:hypothetical protein
MSHPTTRRLAAAIVFGAGMLFASVAAAQAPAKQQSGAKHTCSVKVADDTVGVAATPVVKKASLSEAIGDSISASFPRESNVSVDKVDPSPDGAANTLQLTLNTSKAKPGDWTLSMKGTKGECSGKLKVTGKS